MVLGSGKNPGHTGTDFKHRRGFESTHAFQQKLIRSNSAQLAKGSFKASERLKNNKRKQVLLVGLALLFTVFVFLLWQIFGLITSDIKEHSEKRALAISMKKEQEDVRTFNFLINGGYAKLRAGKLYAAQKDFERAALLLPEEKMAYVGLTETLAEQCFQDGNNCGLAKKYLEFSIKRDWMDTENSESIYAKLEADDQNVPHQ